MEIPQTVRGNHSYELSTFVCTCTPPTTFVCTCTPPAGMVIAFTFAVKQHSLDSNYHSNKKLYRMSGRGAALSGDEAKS